MGKKKQQTPEAEKTPRQKMLDKISGIRSDARFVRNLAGVAIFSATSTGYEAIMNGKTSRDFDEIINLPGVGRYLAGCISVLGAVATVMFSVEANDLNSYANALDAQLKFHPDGPPPQSEPQVAETPQG